MSTLGERLKKARENKRLTQMEVAKKVGISNGTLSGYERDYRDPDTITLRKLADLYEVKVDYLLTGNVPDRNQMIDKIIQKAGDPNSKERDKFADEFLDVLPSISDDVKRLVLDLLKHVKDR